MDDLWQCFCRCIDDASQSNYFCEYSEIKVGLVWQQIAKENKLES